MRIFLSIRFTEEIKDSLIKAMAELRAQNVHGIFTMPENLHLTLAFIGETSQLKEIRAAVDDVKVSPFEISLGAPGRFRDILWLGINGGEPMRRLSEALRSALASHGISYDTKPFKAHITLVRRANVTALPKLDIPPVRMTVSRISVMKSERIAGRLTYTEM